jgi:hypothetical protein
MPDGEIYTRQDVTDISAPTQLVRYAAVGQLAQLRRRRGDLSHAKVAHIAGLGTKREDAGSILSTALGSKLTVSQLVKLDEVIGALAPDLEHTGGLASLDLRVTREARGVRAGAMFAHIPPSWSRAILKEASPSEPEVLVQASALLSACQTAQTADSAGNRSVTDLLDRYHDELDLLVRRLALISLAPPTPNNTDALIMLGILASYAFEPMRQLLDHELRTSPLGFRVWRAITTLVKLTPEQGGHSNALKALVQRLISDSERLRKTSLYAARSLDLELAITVPAVWSPPDRDWVGRALRARVRNPEATLRERGTAATGLWARAITESRPDLASTEEYLRQLIREFNNPETRPDVATGLRWVAATLEYLIDKKLPVCNEWPEIDEPWFRNVQDAASDLDSANIPDHLRTGAKNLFLHMILQNAEVHRRQAIETVVTSGWSEPIADALSRLLSNENEESWLRVRVLFALGFLQRPDYVVEGALEGACIHAHDNLTRTQGKPLRAHITEMHASLFAVGDCFGVPDARERAASIRDSLSAILIDLATAEGDRARILRRAVRAAAYVLVVTARPRAGQEKDLSQELLERLKHHPDPVTARLSQWALDFRFTDNGQVRPWLAAADLRI